MPERYSPWNGVCVQGRPAAAPAACRIFDLSCLRSVPRRPYRLSAITKRWIIAATSARVASPLGSRVPSSRP
ncbi:MAG: hypothetical protein LBS32_01880, partial [Clostridiales Family XIII bacterium]|nr:hypothetical protein [Clostridiales Family XIII bacterium]